MKKSLLAGIALAALVAAPAMAADLGVRPAPAPAYKAPAPVAYGYSWTGVYIGANAGGGWGRKCWTDLGTDGTLSIDEGCHNVSGFLAGGQIGGNYQVGQFVFGVEGSGDWAHLTGSSVSTAFSGDTLNTTVDAIFTATGRIGVAWDALLVYAKGGGAWVDDKYTETNTVGGAVWTNGSEWRTGWTAGGGLEWGFAPNWSVAAEYDYIGLGTKSVTFTNVAGGTFSENINQYIHMGTVRLNYRFGYGAPVSARY